MPDNAKAIEAGMRATVAEFEAALAAQFKNADFKVDEFSIILRMRAISKEKKSLVVNRESVGVVRVGREDEDVIQAIATGPQQG